MATMVALKPATLRHITAELKRDITELKAAEKAAQGLDALRFKIGKKLIELRNSMSQEEFVGHCRDQFDIGKAWAYQLMAVVEGRTTFDKLRAGTRDRVAAHADRQRDQKRLLANRQSLSASSNVVSLRTAAPRERPSAKSTPAQSQQEAEKYADRFEEEAVRFVNNFTERFGVWMRTKPKLSGDAKKSLSQTLHMVANKISRCAQDV